MSRVLDVYKKKQANGKKKRVFALITQKALTPYDALSSYHTLNFYNTFGSLVVYSSLETHSSLYYTRQSLIRGQ